MTNLALAFVLFLCAFLGGFYLGCQYKDKQHWEETYIGDYKKRNRK